MTSSKACAGEVACRVHSLATQEPARYLEAGCTIGVAEPERLAAHIIKSPDRAIRPHNHDAVVAFHALIIDIAEYRGDAFPHDTPRKPVGSRAEISQFGMTGAQRLHHRCIVRPAKYAERGT